MHQEVKTGTPVDLRDTFEELYDIAQRFKGGTQITDPEQVRLANAEAERFLFLVRHAKSLGCTPYEIEQAVKGDWFALA